MILPMPENMDLDTKIMILGGLELKKYDLEILLAAILKIAFLRKTDGLAQVHPDFF